jgi:hypothetical protein
MVNEFNRVEFLEKRDYVTRDYHYLKIVVNGEGFFAVKYRKACSVLVLMTSDF